MPKKKNKKAWDKPKNPDSDLENKFKRKDFGKDGNSGDSHTFDSDQPSRRQVNKARKEYMGGTRKGLKAAGKVSRSQYKKNKKTLAG